MNLFLAKDNEFIEHLSKIILDNLNNENFGVSELIKASGLNRNYLSRRIKSIKKITINQFITEVRLQKARELLIEGTYTAAEVSYNVGFSSPSYFTKCFHDFYGYPPSEIINHITPEKTEKQESKIAKPKTTRKKRWVQVTISAVLILILFVIAGEVFYYRSFEKGKDATKNAIAIMPFVNDSGEEFAPFTAWMGIEIGNKLSKIDNMLVVPQSTTESYRDSRKSNRDIARELLADHILRGRTIKNGDKILLNVELLDTKNGQSLFTEIYERKIEESEEASINHIFEICGDVVLQISEALKTNISPEEKEQIIKKPTENMAALRAYQEANYHLELQSINDISNWRLASRELRKAKILYKKAVKLDSTFADAYTMLGHIYVNKLSFVLHNNYLADRNLDTGKIYLEKALKYDKTNIDAATYLRGYYIQKGLYNEADKLLPLTENRVKNYIYYGGKIFEFFDLNDRYRSLDAYLNYLETKPADVPIPDYITKVAFYNYLNTGFPARALEINEKYWKSVHDTLNYFFRKAELELNYGNQDSAVSICSWLYDIHPAYLLVHFYFVDQSFKLQRACSKEFNMLPNIRGKENFILPQVPPNFYVFGYTFFKEGNKEKADYHFKGSIKKAEEEIELNTANARSYNSLFNLATIYAIINEKQKSLHYLNMIKESKSISIQFINELNTNPMFDNLRNEPEFQEISNELEKKYLEEHEKIKKLLIKHGLEPA